MRRPMKSRKVKWVDDMSCMAALHLPSSLVPDTRPDTPLPVPYRGRHGLRLPDELNELKGELKKSTFTGLKEEDKTKSLI